MSLASLACRRHGRSMALVASRTTTKSTTSPLRLGEVNRKRYFSDQPENQPPPTLQNVLLASTLLGFVGFVFTYSMNTVGRGDEAEDDPLAQLKAEAQEARVRQSNNKPLSKEEVEALESGISADQYDSNTRLEVAVAAPADIAQLEEEANLKVFSKKQQEGVTKKKKPWWRFGF